MWLKKTQRMCGEETKNLKEKWEEILDMTKFLRCQKGVLNFKTNQICKIKIKNRSRYLKIAVNRLRNYLYNKEFWPPNLKKNKNYTNKRSI